MTYGEPPFERGTGALSRTVRTLARFWLLSVPFTVVGVVVGVWLGSLAATTYTAEVRLGVGGQSLDAQTVPGFVFASKELAATYARYVDEASATGQLQDSLGVAAAGTITDVSASPIPESSVLIVEVQGVDEDDVRDGAQTIADSLVEQVSTAPAGEDAAAALAEFEQLSAEVAQQKVLVQSLQSELGRLEALTLPLPAQVTELESVRGSLAEAQAQLDVLTLRQNATGARYSELSGQRNASLSIVREAEVVANDRNVRLLVSGVLGAAVGLGLALFVVRPTKRRSAAALDGPPLEDSTVTGEHERPVGGAQARYGDGDDLSTETSPFDGIGTRRPG